MPGTRSAPALVLAALLSRTAIAQVPQGTAFTYQGQLSEAGIPADGTYDFQLILYDAAVGGSQVGPILTVDDVTVVQGLFTVGLDFGAVFTGLKRWLELDVRPGASPGGYTPVLPRHELSPTPSASFSAATPWTGVSGKPPGFADDVDNDTTYTAGAGLDLTATTFSLANLGVTTPKLAVGAVTSAKIADGTITLADLGQNGCAANQVMKWSGTAWACAADDDSGGTVTSLTAGSGLTGGTITTAGTVAVDFGGTGGATTVARSDHAHFGQTWTGVGTQGLVVENSSPSSTGILGWATATTGLGVGVSGLNSGTSGYGVLGRSQASADGTGVTYGVVGLSQSPVGRGVYGSGATFGVLGESGAGSGVGVSGFATIGVEGRSNAGFGRAVLGNNMANSGNAVGVEGRTESTAGLGVFGLALATSGNGIGVYGVSHSTAGHAGYFQGRVHVTGTLSKGAGSFKIDHPLDPEHKYLYHSFVESPDMKNIYDGLVTTGDDGFATVELPAWFGALNRDFRYQLTVIGDGAWARARVYREIADNRFVIQTDAPETRVSWLVTGIRHDPFAETHRIPVEEDKPEIDRGRYLHPEPWGQPKEKGLDALPERRPKPEVAVTIP